MPHSSRNHISMDENDDKRPERLLVEASLGASQQHQVKEVVKWEIEIVERKTEERFKEIETLIKKIGIKIDHNSASIVEETQNEFLNVKTQFEEFGNTIYERINSEVQDKITFELTKGLSVLQESLNTDFSKNIINQIKPVDVKILSLENQCEELRSA